MVLAPYTIHECIPLGDIANNLGVAPDMKHANTPLVGTPNIQDLGHCKYHENIPLGDISNTEHLENFAQPPSKPVQDFDQ